MDLDLERSSQGYAPANPIVSTSIPDHSGGEVRIGDLGVDMEPGGTSAEGTLVNNKVFYANVDTDTDLLVKPLPTGIETFYQLRSPASPEELAMRLDLPAGAMLRTAADKAASAEIVRDGDVIGTVSVPTAVDAQGQEVPITTSVIGDEIHMRASIRDADYAYPIMVDPAAYYPWNTSWLRGDDPGWAPFLVRTTTPWCQFFGDWYQGRGLYVFSRVDSTLPCYSNPAGYTTDDALEWNYYEEYWRRSTASVYEMETWSFFDPGTGGICHYGGIYSIRLAGWEGGQPYCDPNAVAPYTWWRVCAAGPSCTPTTGDASNYAVFGTQSIAAGRHDVFTNTLQAVTIYVSDSDQPTLDQGSPGVPAGWVSHGSISAHANDPGVGVNLVRITSPQTPNFSATGNALSTCNVDPDWHCPPDDTAKGSTDDLNEGINTISATATDYIGGPGHTITNSQLGVARVDRTAPQAPSLSGLSSRRAVNAGTYDLNIADHDVHPSGVTHVSGAKSGSVDVDGTTTSTASKSSCTDDCDLSWTYTLDANAPFGPAADDSFDGIPGTQLEQHTPNRGGPWKQAAASTNSEIVDASARAQRGVGTGKPIYYLSTTPQSADYDVSATLYWPSTTTMVPGDSITLLGRLDPTTGAAYGATVNALSATAVAIGVSVWQNGTGQAFGNVVVPRPSSGSAPLKLSLRGTKVTATLGTQSVSYTAKNPTTPGYAGLVSTLRNSANPFFELDDFHVQAVDPAPRYPEGKHHFVVHTTDGAGNAGPDSSFDTIIDRTAPTVTADGPARRAVVGDDVYDLDITATDPKPVADVAGIDHVEVLVDGQPQQVDGSPGSDGNESATYHFDATQAAYEAGHGFAEGDHTVRVRAVDGAGNWADDVTYTVRIDRTPPTLSLSGALRQPLASGTGVHYDAADDGGGVKDVSIWVDPADPNDPGTPQDERILCTDDTGCPAEAQGDYILPPTTGEGDHTLLVRATDPFGRHVDEQWHVGVVNVRAVDRTKLGLEHYFAYDATDAGGGSPVYVNGQTGNVVWHSVPIVDPSRGLSTVVNLTYNSLDRGGMLGSSLGRIPLVDVSGADLNGYLPGLSYGEAGVGVSVGVSGPTRVNEPLQGVLEAQAVEEGQSAIAGVRLPAQLGTSADLKITLTDADGTEHSFRKQDNGDWAAPDGMDVHLRRYRDGGSALQPWCDKWAMTRPDGVTYFFDNLGYLRAIKDRDSNTLTYRYERFNAFDPAEPTTDAPCAWTDADAASMTPLGLIGQLVDGSGNAIPSVTGGQAAGLYGLRLTTVTDPAGRDLTIDYENKAVLDALQPGEVYDAAMSASPTEIVGGLAGRIAAITDQAGRKYTLGYDDDGYLTRFVEDQGTSAERATELIYEAKADGAAAYSQDRELTDVVELRDGDNDGKTTSTGDAQNPTDGADEYARTHIDYGDRSTGGFLGFGASRPADVVTDRADGRTEYSYGTAAGSTPATFTVSQRLLTAATPSDERWATSTQELDGLGRPTSVTSPLGTKTVLGWNADNKVTSVIKASGTADEVKTEYAYDTDNGTGSLTGKTEYPDWPSTDHARTTTFTYDYSGGVFASSAASKPDDGKSFVADLKQMDNPKADTGWKLTLDDQHHGHVLEQADAKGYTAKTSYDGQGQITDEYDELGRHTHYADYDPTGQPQTVTDPRGGTWTYHYDPAGDVTAVVDPRATDRTGASGNSYTTTLSYDALGRLTTAKRPMLSDPATFPDAKADERFSTETWSYDRNGNVLSDTDGTGQTTDISYTKMDQPQLVDAPGSTGREIAGYAYDDADRLIAQVSPRGAPGTQTLSGLTATQRQACEDQDGPAPVAFTQRFCLDDDGRVLAAIRYSTRAGDSTHAGDDPMHVVSYAYDRRDNVTGQIDAKRNLDRSVPDAISAAGDPALQRLSYAYDKLDEPTSQTDHPTEKDQNGNPIAPTQWTYGYDDNGNRTTIGYPHPGRTTILTYDQRDALIGSEDQPLDRLTCLKRDQTGAVIAQTTPRGTAGDHDKCFNGDPTDLYTYFTTVSTYDSTTGDLASRSIPFAPNQYGKTDDQLQGWKVSYTKRNGVGDPTEITDARGNLITNTFDDADDLLTTDRPSWWQLDWGGGEPGPSAGDKYADNPAATASVDTEVTPGGPQLTENDGRSSNAASSDQAPDLPDGRSEGNFGRVDQQELPDMLPQAGATSFSYDADGRLTTITDAALHERKIGYDAAGRVSSKTWPFKENDPIVHSFGYDPDGNLSSTEVTDGLDNIETTYDHDGYDRQITETAPGSNATKVDDPAEPQVTNFAYDANDNLTTRETPRGTATKDVTGDYTFGFSYDSLDRLTSETNPAAETWSYDYDVSGNRTSAVSPRGQGQSGPELALYTTTLSYDGGDELKNVVQKVCQNPTADQPCAADHVDTLTTTFGYDDDGERNGVTSPGSNEQDRTTTTTYDGRGLPWQTTAGTGDDARTTVTEYDPNGNLRRTVNPAGVGSDHNPKTPDDGSDTGANLDTASTNATVRSYDASDLLTSIRLPWDGRDTRKFSEQFLRNGDPLSRVTSIVSAHEAGDTAAPRTSYTYFDTDWISSESRTEQKDTTSTDPVSDPLVTYDFDKRGLQTSWRTASYSDSSKGRLVTRTFWPDGTLKTRTAKKPQDTDPTTSRTYDYLYDPNRSLVQFIDTNPPDPANPDGTIQPRTTTITRDSAERETRVNESWRGGRDTVLAYDADGNVKLRRTDGLLGDDGSYTGDDAKSTTFEYDSLDREYRMNVAPPSGATRTTTTTWWPSGDIHERDKAQGARDIWDYDTRGDATRHQRFESGATDPADDQSYEYDLDGNRTHDERGTHEFNARDQLVAWTHPDGAKVSRTDYLLNGSGSILTKTDSKADGSKDTTLFCYASADSPDKCVDDAAHKADNGDRLSYVRAPDVLQSYRYDDLGNVVRVYYQPLDGTVLPPVDTSPITDPKQCTDEPDTQTPTVTEYCFDEFERPVFSKGQGVKNPTLVTFDGLDRRDSTTTTDDAGAQNTGDDSYVGTTDLLSREVLTSTDAQGDQVTKRKTYDYDSRGAVQGQDVVGGQTADGYHAYAKDANGSITGVEDSGGSLPVNQRYRYDPYGQLLSADDSTATDPEAALAPAAQDNPFRYEGFYYDSGVQTYDMLSRSYRPDIGRFLSEDRFESASGDQVLEADPLTQNRYAFAGGNPANNVEFDGHYTDGNHNNEPDPCSVPGSCRTRRDTRQQYAHLHSFESRQAAVSMTAAVGSVMSIPRRAVHALRQAHPVDYGCGIFNAVCAFGAEDVLPTVKSVGNGVASGASTAGHAVAAGASAAWGTLEQNVACSHGWDTRCPTTGESPGQQGTDLGVTLASTFATDGLAALARGVAQTVRGGVAAYRAYRAARGLEAAAKAESDGVQAAWGVGRYKHGGVMSTIEHINYRHAFNSGFADVSQFSEGTSVRDIKGYVEEALRRGEVSQGGGTINYDLGRVIGTDQAGNAVTGIRIHVHNGVIRTAYPVAP